MISIFKTPDKKYELSADKYCCNKFGLAEFLSDNINELKLSDNFSALDAGCGVCPIGIFLSEQFNCSVVGVELNSIAFHCAINNVSKYNLDSKINLYNKNFVDFSNDYTGDKFNIIVANPPIDEFISQSAIEKYCHSDFESLDDETFSYLTNSWHSSDGRDLSDYIFEFAVNNLDDSGCILIVFCTIDCNSDLYMEKKAAKYGFYADTIIDGYISPDSVGFRNSDIDKIKTYIIKFIRR